MPRLVRDLFTGKYREEPFVGEGRQIIAKTNDYANFPRKTYGMPYNRPLVSRSLSVGPFESAAFNQRAHDAGNTGVHYEPDGTCTFLTRRGRKEECERRQMFDADAGYNDPVAKRS